MRGFLKTLIVAGGRDFDDYYTLRDILDRHMLGRGDVAIVSGHARGVDQMAEAYAQRAGIPVATYPADWKRYGKRAGMVRNAEMADVADELVAIWDGKSRGTAAMINMMRRRKKPVTVYDYSGKIREDQK